MIQRLFSRGSSNVTEHSPVQRMLLDRLQGVPFFAPVQLYIDTLEKMRPWWPILLPLLAWSAWRAYQEEQATIAARLTNTT